MSLDAQKLQELINGYANSENINFLVPNTTEDFLAIRPSGNPISAKGLDNMYNNADLVIESSNLEKIHRLEVNVDWGYAAFTLKEVFTFKGDKNNDNSTYSMIFKKIEGCWKIAWMQRSTGSTDLSTWSESEEN